MKSLTKSLKHLNNISTLRNHEHFSELRDIFMEIETYGAYMFSANRYICTEVATHVDYTEPSNSCNFIKSIIINAVQYDFVWINYNAYMLTHDRLAITLMCTHWIQNDAARNSYRPRLFSSCLKRLFVCHVVRVQLGRTLDPLFLCLSV